MTIFFLVLLTYVAIISRLVYDIIVEPPGIGSTQDHSTGIVCPIVFLPGRINGQYIIEGLSSGFMFMLGAVSFILMDLALDCNRAGSVCTSFAVVSTSTMFIVYAMNPHQDLQLPLVIPLSFLLTIANLPPTQDPLFRRFISRLSSPAGGSSSFFLADDFEDVLVNDGRFVIHGIDGFIAPLASSPPSCHPSFR